MPTTTTHRTRLLIIGAGPAGYTAAIYAARAALAPILVAGLQPGGQLTITTDVENYPGFAETIQGPWLMEQMAQQAEHVGTRIIYDIITASISRARRSAAWAIRAIPTSPTRWSSPPARRRAGSACPASRRCQGVGVSACATCDGFFFRGKRVAVIGGGNTAVEEALYLTHHAEHRDADPSPRLRCGPRRSCRTACSPTRRSRWSGTARWRKFLRWPAGGA